MNRLAWMSRSIAALLLCAATSVQSLEVSCSDSVLVTVDRRCDWVQVICEAAADARDFLRDAGFDTSAFVRIKVVERLPHGIDPHAVACYVHPQRCVYLLPPSRGAASAHPGVAPMPRIPYRSWVSHEVAHAIAAANFHLSEPTIQAHEYIAYVTMFATMPPAERDRLLGAFPGDGFDSQGQITTTLFLLAPHWFGAEAYRHYRALEAGGPAFLRKVLSGQALDEPNGW